MFLHTRKVQGVAVAATAAAGVALLMSAAFAADGGSTSFVVELLQENSCVVTASDDITFASLTLDGDLEVVAATDAANSITIDVDCNYGEANGFISLLGEAGTGFAMTDSGANDIAYRLFTAANGGGTEWLRDTDQNLAASHTVFARIDAGTLVPVAGAYDDIVTVTVSF